MSGLVEVFVEISGIKCEAYSTGSDENSVYQGVEVYQVGGLRISELLVDACFDDIQEAFHAAAAQAAEDYNDEMKVVVL